MFKRLLWGVVLLYPILFAVADDRSIYSSGRQSNPLGGTGTFLLLSSLTLAAGLVLHYGLTAWKESRAIPPVAPWLLVYFSFDAMLQLVRGEFHQLTGILIPCLVLLAFSLLDEEPGRVMLRVRRVLRVQVLLSLALALLIPSWALVPPEHSGRALFGLGTRLIGLSAGPNYLGSACAMLLILEVGLKTGHRSLRFICGLAAISAGVWAQGRTSLAVMLVGAAAALLLPRLQPVSQAKLSRALVWLPVVGMLGLPLLILWAMRFNSESLASLTTGRVYVWQVAWELIKNAPLGGNSQAAITATIDAATGEDLLNAHNQLLETFTRGGIILAIPMLGLLFSLCKHLSDSARDVRLIAPLALVVLGQLPFGTPLRLQGLSWNVVELAVLVACVNPSGYVHKGSAHDDDHVDVTYPSLVVDSGR